MKIMIFGDLHMADRPPVGRIDDYRETGLSKLQEIGRICKKEKADLAVGLGDWYHLKQPNRVSHRLVRDTIRICQDFPCPIWGIIGNHDQTHDGSIEGQPLSVLREAGALQLLDKATSFSGVLIIPRHWNTQRDDDPAYYSPTDEELGLPAIARILIAHGSIVNPGNSRPFPFVDVSEIPGIEELDLLACGHLHENLGIHQVGQNTWFANPGSVMRVSRNQASYSRKVQVLKVEVAERDLKTELIDIPVAPAVEVFGAKEPEPNRYELNDQVQQFIEQLGEGLRADELTIPELLAGLDLEPNVAQLVQHLLEEAAT